MRRFDPALVWGGLLIVGGVLFLLQNLGLFTLSQYLWSLALGVLAALFLGQFVMDRSRWWPLIPGIILASLAAMLAVQQLAPGANWLDGTIILGGIGLAFFAVYLANRNNWWAIIPGGIMATLAVVAGLDNLAEVREITDMDTGGVFFIGLGLTFGLLYILPTPQGRMKWAAWPATPLLLLGILLLAGSTSLAGLVWPALLILAGLFLAVRALRPRS